MKKKISIPIYSFFGISLFLFSLGFIFHFPDIPIEQLNKKYNVKSSEYILVDGLNVHYQIEGLTTDTVPLILLHGTFSSMYAWNGWKERLKDKHKIIRLDLPGFGLTGPHPEGDYSHEAYLNFLQSFLTELGIKQCILAGNSLGGEIAWRYAANNPQQVKMLVLIGAAGYPVEITELPLYKLPFSYLWLRIPMIRDVSIQFTTPTMVRNSLEYLYGNPEKVTESLVALYFDMILREGNREALTERMETFGRPAPLEKIPFIKTPVLILWGGKDNLIPVENAKKFHQDLPNSKLVIFPNAGHMPMEEIPDKTASIAEQFFNNYPSNLTEQANAKK